MNLQMCKRDPKVNLEVDSEKDELYFVMKQETFFFPICWRLMSKGQKDPWGQEDPLEKEMETHSSTLAWEIPWMEEPGRLQSMGL